MPELLHTPKPGTLEFCAMMMVCAASRPMGQPANVEACESRMTKLPNFLGRKQALGCPPLSITAPWRDYLATARGRYRPDCFQEDYAAFSGPIIVRDLLGRLGKGMLLARITYSGELLLAPRWDLALERAR